MKITFLEAEVPLTKTFALENGQITKIGHPKMIDCTSHHYDVKDLSEFAVRLHWHAARGHCLLKGNTARELKMESRAGTTDPNAPTTWLCLDLDGLKHIRSVQEFMDSIGLGDVSYVVQYSASSGVLPDRGLSAHVFVLLDREHLPDALKQWLKHKNFSVPGLRAGVSLTRTGNALRWTLDVTTCQNDKLIYIAPPLLGVGVTDGFEGERIQLVQRVKPMATLDASGVNPEVNRAQEQLVLDALRAEKGLEKKKWDRTKSVHGMTFMPSPDVSTLTGIKEERGFVYLNLNGGDSWGYYHTKDNPDFVRNFKGEPNYRTSELLPDYWAGLQRAKRVERNMDDKAYLIFRDFAGSTYYNAVYDPVENELKIASVRSEQQARDFLTQHGQTQPEIMETWDLKYDPQTYERVSQEGCWLNLYQPSSMERQWRKAPEKVTQLPAIARRWWLNALANDEACLERLVNWMACLVQFKCRLETGWYLQGEQGTGKSLIFAEWLRPMLGDTNVLEKGMEELETEFTGFLENKMLVMVNEGDIDQQRSAKIIESRLKRMVSDKFVSVRHMRQEHREVPNLLNFILTSNRHGVNIENSDRRWNVAPYQSVVPPKPSPAEMAEIRASVWPVYCYFMQYPADIELARHALDNQAKADMIEKSRNSIEAACASLLAGDYTYFTKYVERDPLGLSNSERELASQYNELVGKMREYDALSRQEVHVLINWLTGEISPAASRFSKMLAMNRIVLTSVRRSGAKAPFHGMKVNWRKDA